MPQARPLIHSEWFDHALAQLGDLPNVEEILAEEFYRVACSGVVSNSFVIASPRHEGVAIQPNFR